MRLRNIALLLLLVLMAVPAVRGQEGWPAWVPRIGGTIRAKYEYEPSIEKSRFQVRNVRIGLSGKIIPIISYNAEVDLCNEGHIKMLDAYVRFEPQRWTVTFGQMRVPFTLDAHRAPRNQFFANRSFIAKQIAYIRDVGLAASFSPLRDFPWVLQAGIFNGSGLENQKDFWTNSFNFSFKTQATIASHYTLEFSCQKARPYDVSVMMWDAAACYQSERWHFEAEYLRKNYSRGLFKGVNSVDIFGAYRLPLSHTVSGISFLMRYDYLSDHSTGAFTDDGSLTVNDPERHRITGGITLHFGSKKLLTDLRLNYEKFFYGTDVTTKISDQDKLVVELMCCF